jgi:hypothetical protein
MTMGHSAAYLLLASGLVSDDTIHRVVYSPDSELLGKELTSALAMCVLVDCPLPVPPPPSFLPSPIVHGDQCRPIPSTGGEAGIHLGVAPVWTDSRFPPFNPLSTRNAERPWRGCLLDRCRRTAPANHPPRMLRDEPALSHCDTRAASDTQSLPDGGFVFAPPFRRLHHATVGGSPGWRTR